MKRLLSLLMVFLSLAQPVVSQTILTSGGLSAFIPNAASGGQPSPDLLWYLMAEGSGTTTADSGTAGGNHTATLVNSPTWSTGPTGHGAIAFNVNQSLQFTGPASGTTYSISMWIDIVVDNNAYASLFTQDDAAGVFLRKSGVAINIDLYYGGDHLNTTSLTPLFGTWVSVIIVVSGGSGTFYINGAADGTFTGATSFTPSRMGNDSTGEFYNGKIADMEFYSTALTSGQIASLYGGGTGAR